VQDGRAWTRRDTEHLVQLFDDADTLAESVSEFVAEGLRRQDLVMVVATRTHSEAIMKRLGSADAAAALRSGSLTMQDAEDSLKLFMRRGRPDRGLFARSIVPLVHDLVSHGRSVRIYGEMVDLLAAEGNFTGARELEDLWNELATEKPFRLFCGYSAVHFGDVRTADQLRQICGAHTHVRTHTRDVLGSFLLQTYAAGPAR
jgi:hypothetical protein